MPLYERLRTFLSSQHAEYTRSVHPRVFTTREVATAEHLPPREVAKSVVLFEDGEYRLVTIPANNPVTLEELRPGLRLAPFPADSKVFLDSRRPAIACTHNLVVSLVREPALRGW